MSTTENEGVYLDRASLLARIETLTAEVELRRGLAESELRAIQERDAAKADAARLREALKKRHEHDFVGGPCDQPGHHKCDCWQAATAALSASDSAKWLAKHDAEVAKPLRKRIAELEAAMSQIADWDGEEPENSALVAKVDTLTKQLVAATNDAARAELRAKDAVARITKLSLLKEMDSVSPDDDARLREVIQRALELGFDRGVASERDSDCSADIQKDIDEVLRGGA